MVGVKKTYGAVEYLKIKTKNAAFQFLLEATSSQQRERRSRIEWERDGRERKRDTRDGRE